MTEDIERQDAEQRPDEDTDFDMDADESPRAAVDWGLKKPKSGMGKEIKIGVTILALIGGIFGYVLYKNSADSAAEVVKQQGETKTAKSPPRKEEEIILAHNTAPQNETPRVASPPVDMTGRTASAASREPAAGQTLDYGSPAPAQDLGQQREDYRDILAEADAIDDARSASNDPAANDLWEDSTVAGRTAAHTDNSQENFSDLPPDQGDQWEDSDVADLTSLNNDTNPYAESSNVDSFDDGTTTSEEPAADTFGQNDLPAEPLDDQEFSGELDSANNQDFGTEPAEGFQDTSITQDTSVDPDPSANEFDELTGTTDFAGNGNRSPVGAEITSEIEEAATGADAVEPQYADPRTGQFHNVTQHTGRASSTTIVRRSEELPLEEETALSESPPAQSRVDGYRAVGSYQNEIVNGRDAAATEQLTEQFTDESADFSEAQYAGSAGGVSPRAADNRTYGFDQPNQDEEAFQTPPKDHGSTYVVEANDSFWSIARQTYGDPKYFQALAKFNEHAIPDPKFMRPGIEVATPPAAKLESLYPELFGDVQQASQHIAADSAASSSGEWLDDEEFRGRVGYGTGETMSRAAANASGFFVANDGRPQYRVISGDNLGAIARRHLGKASRWEEIYRLNRDHLTDPNRLKIGTVLRLPNDALREQVVTRPEFGR